ncbi:MAG: DNA polymerase III subunit delta [Ruminococcaceae bacterium]|nr:DNA polymerase III subunit delta [Oscillospiraceae bacterium]
MLIFMILWEGVIGTDRVKADIKSGQFRSLYFFLGEEEYLNDYYSEEIVKALVPEGMKIFNYLSFSIDFDLDAFENFLNSPPIMNPKKVVYIKDCGLCSKSVKEDVRDRVKEIISDLPSYATLIINESNPTKTMGIYKTSAKVGIVVENKFQKINVLQSWVVRSFEKDGYTISPDDALYLVENGDNGMYFLKNEIDKLKGYKVLEKTVTKEDIEKCIVKSIEGKVFDMLDCMFNSQMNATFRHLADLKTLKEPVKRILAIIMTELTRIKKAKILDGKMSKNDLSKALSVNPFFVDKVIKRAKAFSTEYINEMIILCQKTDFDIISGKKEQWQALEDLIIKSHNLKKRI